MQPTASEIEQEKEALRDLRRRSVAQLPSIDPDLPIPTSGSGVYASELDDDTIIGGDPSHLFWVPADVHPELAPGEFRVFLKEQANLVRTRSNASTLSDGGVSRRKSHLSRQYRPGSVEDLDRESKVKPRRRSTLNRGEGLNITLEELQHLEDVATSGDTDQLKKAIRRSMSVGAGVPYVEESAEDPNVPIPLVHRPSGGPGQIVRRAARTKIRKPGVGGSLSFHSQRRGSTGSFTRDSKDGHPPLPVPSTSEPPRIQDMKDDRPLSFSEEASIFDSYSYDTYDQDNGPETPATSYTHITPTAISSIPPEPAFAVIKPQQPNASIPLHHPSPHQHQTPPHLNVPPPPPLHRTPSPPDIQSGPPPAFSKAHVSPPQPQSTPTKKEKEKKGPFFSFGSKKVKTEEKAKEKEKEKEREPKEKEDKDGFLSSLFSSRKKPAANAQSGPTTSDGQAGPHLGPSNALTSRTPSPSNSQTIMNYSRYPIHVERAVYRLSHIKLANPRRALLEQVLISNLMFWYLGVINRTGAGQQNNATQSAPQQPQQDEEPEAAQKPTPPQPAIQQASPEPQPDPQPQQRPPKQTQRRASLTKPDTREGRRAEMPVKAVSYEAQARSLSMEGDYPSGDADYDSYDSRGAGRGGGGWHRGTPPQHQHQQVQPERMWQADFSGNGRPRDGGDMEGAFYYQPPPASASGAASSNQQRSYNESEGFGSMNYAGVGVVGSNGLPPGAMMPLEHTPIPEPPQTQYDYRDYREGGERADRGDQQQQQWNDHGGGGGYQRPSQGGSGPGQPQSRKKTGSGRKKSPTSPSNSDPSPTQVSPPPGGQLFESGDRRSRSPPPPRSPTSSPGIKLQGRSLSASAVPLQPVKTEPSVSQQQQRLRKKSGPSSPNRSLPIVSGGAEDEDIPLALWQERHKKR